jgi:amidase
MPWFGQEILEMAAAKGDLRERSYRLALKKTRKLSRRRGIDALMKKHRFDALTAPSGGPAWKTDWINGDHFSIGSASFAAASGYPNITVPAGFIHGLPVGISFFGAACSEGLLLKLASGYEQISYARRAPEYKPE